jgi:hypothetical protein
MEGTSMHTLYMFKLTRPGKGINYVTLYRPSEIPIESISAEAVKEVKDAVYEVELLAHAQIPQTIGGLTLKVKELLEGDRVMEEKQLLWPTDLILQLASYIYNDKLIEVIAAVIDLKQQREPNNLGALS